MAYTTPSRYQPVWEVLKTKGEAILIADPALHPRLKKALYKRKTKDLTYKFILFESHKKAKLSAKSEGNKLILTLTIEPYLKSIGAF